MGLQYPAVTVDKSTASLQNNHIPSDSNLKTVKYILTSSSPEEESVSGPVFVPVRIMLHKSHNCVTFFP